MKILIADDDLDDLELIEEILLEFYPHVIVEKVMNGQAVLNYLHTTTPENFPCLIILDYNMPELKGSEVLELICKDLRFSHLPIVILSTSNAAIHIQECKDKGARDYFIKPNTIQQLRNTVKDILKYCN